MMAGQQQSMTRFGRAAIVTFKSPCDDSGCSRTAAVTNGSQITWLPTPIYHKQQWQGSRHSTSPQQHATMISSESSTHNQPLITSAIENQDNHSRHVCLAQLKRPACAPLVLLRLPKLLLLLLAALTQLQQLGSCWAPPGCPAAAHPAAPPPWPYCCCCWPWLCRCCCC